MESRPQEPGERGQPDGPGDPIEAAALAAPAEEPAEGPAGHPVEAAELEALAVEPPGAAEAAVAFTGAAFTGAAEARVAPTVGGSRARWLIGGGIAVAAVAALALGASLLGARPGPEALRYVPADSAIVVELRPELPGDQRDRLGTLLAHFPGFADQSILDQKIDEVLERAVREGSNGEVDYATQVEPLLEGPLVISMSAGGLGNAMSGASPAGLLLVATTDGEVTCSALEGTGGVATTHRGVEIAWVDRELACAIHDRYMLLGAPVAIQGGLDARLDGRGLDGSATYKAAIDELDGDQLASVYVRGDALEGLIPDASAQFGLDLPEMEIPAWTIIGLRAEDDALVLDGVAAPVKAADLASGAPTTAPAGESRFAASLPADTLGYAEVHGVGAMLGQGLAALRADPDAAEAFKQIESALVLLGGADNLVGWIEEAGIAVVPTADGVGGALLIRGTDAEAATARVTQIQNLLALAATGTDITVRETEHGGVTVTLVDLGDLGSLLGGLGGITDLGDLGGLGDLGLGELPVPEDVGEARLAFAIAVRDDLVLVAVGDGVAERILDVETASSLETTEGYRRAIALAGPSNNLQAYIAIEGVLGFAEGLASGEDLDTWNREVQPYAEHLTGLAWSSNSSGTASHWRLVLTVK